MIAGVLHALLTWIDRADWASQRNEPPPQVAREDGSSIFPEGEWWLTELEQRRDRSDDNTFLDAEFDPEDVSKEAAEAATCCSDSTQSAGEESNASLPAGPSPKREHCTSASARTSSSGGSTKMNTTMHADSVSALESSASRDPLVLPQELQLRSSASSSKTPDAATQQQTFPSSQGPLERRLRRHWPSPQHPVLESQLGEALREKPSWYNHPSSGALSSHGTQLGATCGLFAANHAVAVAASLRGIDLRVLARADSSNEGLQWQSVMRLRG